MAELLREFEYQIKAIELIPSDGGKFEVTLGDNLVYSKLKKNRHAEPGEVLELMKKAI
jgi:selT/selW/selH-like putative selenoprotein